jgi:hypothetical protein
VFNDAPKQGDNGISDNSEDNCMMYLSQQELSLEIDKDMTHCHNDNYLHEYTRSQS